MIKEDKLLHFIENSTVIWCYSASIAHWRTVRRPLTAVWEPTEVSMGANLRTRLPVCSKPRCSVRVSPSDNYSSNMELAIEALIRMKMSQLASYQSISGETRFKQDIKDGRTVSSLFPNHPHKLIVRVPLWKKKHSWSNQIEGGVHKRVQNVNKIRGLGREAIAHTSRGLHPCAEVKARAGTHTRCYSQTWCPWVTGEQHR